MIVTLTGAYRNAGDHLIGHRARALLSRYVDEEIIDIPRDSIDASAYDTMNRSNTVILCGGPAYQRNMYPNVYPLELDVLTVPVVPMGLGWKGKLGETTERFSFSSAAQHFIQRIHESIESGSCRDHSTLDVLAHLGVKNTLMTGCPAWYNLEKLDSDFEPCTPRNIVFSDPASVDRKSFGLAGAIRKQFPSADIHLALHHGYYPRLNRSGARFCAEHLALAGYAQTRGFRTANLANSLTAMSSLYDNCDLHIGYRVHAHLYCMAARIPSILIAEDSRGIGQAHALAQTVIRSDNENLVEAVLQEIELLMQSGPAYFQPTLTAMKTGFDSMRIFLESLRHPHK